MAWLQEAARQNAMPVQNDLWDKPWVLGALVLVGLALYALRYYQSRHRRVALKSLQRVRAADPLIMQTLQAIGSQLGRQIIRGVLGSILGGRSR